MSLGPQTFYTETVLNRELERGFETSGYDRMTNARDFNNLYAPNYSNTQRMTSAYDFSGLYAPNNAISQGQLGGWQGGQYRDPLSMPTVGGPAGAMTFPAQGPFSTPADIDMGEPDAKGGGGDSDKKGGLSIIWLLVAGVVVFYVLVPR